MTEETEEERRKRLEKRKAAFLRELEEEPPFDRQVYDAEMKALEGTMWETALMDPDGNICVKTGMAGMCCGPTMNNTKNAKLIMVCKSLVTAMES